MGETTGRLGVEVEGLLELDDLGMAGRVHNFGEISCFSVGTKKIIFRSSNIHWASVTVHLKKCGAVVRLQYHWF